MLFALRSQSSSFFVTIIIFNYLSLFKISCSHSICLGIDSVFLSLFLDMWFMCMCTLTCICMSVLVYIACVYMWTSAVDIS